jgi:hypothetical protein
MAPARLLGENRLAALNRLLKLGGILVMLAATD